MIFNITSRIILLSLFFVLTDFDIEFNCLIGCTSNRAKEITTRPQMSSPKGLPVVMEKKTTFRDISARKHPLVIGKKGNWPDIMFNSILQNDRGNSDTL